MRSSYDVSPATPPPLSLHPPPASTAFLTISKEHDNATLESPRRLKRRLDIAVGRLTTYQSQMRAQQQKRSRLHHKLEEMGIIIEELKANQIVSTSCADLLEASCSGIPWINMKHLLAGRQPSKGHAYHEELLKAFAFTLHFHSATVYDFDRQSFKLPCSTNVIYMVCPDQW